MRAPNSYAKSHFSYNMLGCTPVLLIRPIVELQEVAVAAVWALSNQRLSVAVLEPQLEKLLQVLQIALGPTAPWGSSQRCHFYAILTLTYMYKHLAPQMLLKPHWVAYAWRYLLEEAADIKPEVCSRFSVHLLHDGVLRCTSKVQGQVLLSCCRLPCICTSACNRDTNMPLE